MSGFIPLTTGVAAPPSGVEPAHTDEIFAEEDGWTGWDGPVWSNRYKKYITHQDAVFEEAQDAVNAKHDAKVNGAKGSHSEDLHKEDCPCSLPSHHTAYVQDIKRRIEPMVLKIVTLEHQIATLWHHLVKNGEDLAHKEAQRTKDFTRGEHIHQHADPMAETLTRLSAQVEEVVQKMHLIVSDAEREIKKDLQPSGNAETGNKQDVQGQLQTEEPRE